MKGNELLEILEWIELIDWILEKPYDRLNGFSIDERSHRLKLTSQSRNRSIPWLSENLMNEIFMKKLFVFCIYFIDE